jgi:hypothetical protein
MDYYREVMTDAHFAVTNGSDQARTPMSRIRATCSA